MAPTLRPAPPRCHPPICGLAGLINIKGVEGDGLPTVKSCRSLADENNNNQTDKETEMKDLMAGIDLHSNNIMTGLMDQEGKRVAQQKLPCELKRILEFLAPYKERLHTLAVESTYNWYWL